jgi:hypothetical protein
MGLLVGPHRIGRHPGRDLCYLERDEGLCYPVVRNARHLLTSLIKFAENELSGYAKRPATCATNVGRI